MGRRSVVPARGLARGVHFLRREPSLPDPAAAPTLGVSKHLMQPPERTLTLRPRVTTAEDSLRPTRAEIDLDALVHNLAIVRAGMALSVDDDCSTRPDSSASCLPSWLMSARRTSGIVCVRMTFTLALRLCTVGC